MVRKILNWCDEKYDEALDNDDGLKLYAKSAGIGAIEGTIDGLVIGGIVCYVAAIIGSIVEKIRK